MAPTPTRSPRSSGPVAAALIVAVAAALAPARVRADDAGTARRAALGNLVRQDCGSCHGLTLKGGLGPPLLPATLADRPGDALAEIILGGVPGTPMPPWRGLLTEDEARQIADMLRKGLVP